jgi:hypothetical protein
MEEGEGSLSFLQAIYRNPEVPLPVRMRAAMAALPFENPKLAVVATVDGNKDFAFQLDQAVERTRRVLMIEDKPMIGANTSANASSDTTKPQVQVSNGHKPTIPDRRYRRW